MAKVVEQLLVIRVSKLVKDTDSDSLDVLNDEISESMVEVVENLIGTDSGYVVELIKE